MRNGGFERRRQVSQLVEARFYKRRQDPAEALDEHISARGKGRNVERHIACASGGLAIGVAHILQRQADPLDPFGLAPAGGHGRRAGLDQAAKLDQVGEEVGRQLRRPGVPCKHVGIKEMPVDASGNDRPGPAARPNQSLGGQDLEGLPHRLAADAISLGQFRLARQGVSLLYVTGYDLPAQFVRDAAVLGGRRIEPIWNSVGALRGGERRPPRLTVIGRLSDAPPLDFRDLPGRGRQQHFHGLSRRIGITGVHRPVDGPVPFDALLEGRLRGALKRKGRLKQGRDDRAQSIDQRIAARREDGDVEGDVGGMKGGEAVGIAGHLLESRADLGKLLRRTAPCGQRRRGRLDQEPQLDQIAQKIRRQSRRAVPGQDIRIKQVPMAARGDSRAGSPPCRNQTLCRQNLQGLANCLTADMVRVGEFGLARQKRPLRHTPRNDLATDLVSDLTMQGTGRVKPT